MRAMTAWHCFAILAASACAQTTTVGISDDSDTAPEPGPSSARTKHPSVFVAAAGEALEWNVNPVLGDLDGDGFDDFALVAFDAWVVPDSQPRTGVYLFYGRPEFPEQLSTADADAVFRSNAYSVSPLGDIDGDGLDDFAMRNERLRTYEIMRGNRTRFSGAYEPHQAGLLWESEPLVPFPASPPSPLWIRAAGDVNCDGRGDLLATALKETTVNELERQFVGETLLVLGRTQLPVGLWQRDWAVAAFGGAGGQAKTTTAMTLRRAGDLDADGCDDLLAELDSTSSAVFYGGATRFAGELTGDAADAVLEHAVGSIFAVPDLDGDGVVDLVRASENRLGIDVTYGSAMRAVGRQPLAPDFELKYESGEFHSFDAGDISGDGLADIVIGSGRYALTDQRAARGVMYVVRGTGTRASGVRRLSESDILLMGPPPASELSFEVEYPGLGASLTVAGDVDGDGSRDVLAAAPSASNRGAVFLLPSAPRAPD